ncbi:hypothetical protein PSEUDO8AS_40190 [Pseudomonas sp. 8AS]|nr:hypothetical protein PSEUDO8AS_40190 [Pseudomonas sp. 8AS]
MLNSKVLTKCLLQCLVHCSAVGEDAALPYLFQIGNKLLQGWKQRTSDRNGLIAHGKAGIGCSVWMKVASLWMPQNGRISSSRPPCRYFCEYHIENHHYSEDYSTENLFKPDKYRLYQTRTPNFRQHPAPIQRNLTSAG